MKCWERTSRNSLAQFMATRIRYAHISTHFRAVHLPGATVRFLPIKAGTTYRRDA